MLFDSLDDVADALRGTLSPAQAARKVRINERQVRRWVTQGRLRAVRTPGGYRIRPEDLTRLYWRVNADGGAR